MNFSEFLPRVFSVPYLLGGGGSTLGYCITFSHCISGVLYFVYFFSFPELDTFIFISYFVCLLLRVYLFSHGYVEIWIWWRKWWNPLPHCSYPGQCFRAHIDSYGHLIMWFGLWLLGFSTNQLVVFFLYSYLMQPAWRTGFKFHVFVGGISKTCRYMKNTL